MKWKKYVLTYTFLTFGKFFDLKFQIINVRLRYKYKPKKTNIYTIWLITRGIDIMLQLVKKLNAYLILERLQLTKVVHVLC